MIDGGDGTTALGGSITIFIGWGHGHTQHCNSQWASLTVQEMHSVSQLVTLWEPLHELPGWLLDHPQPMVMEA